MRIHFKGTRYDIPAPITEYAKKRLDALKKFVGKNGSDAVQVYADLGKASGAHQNGRIWRAELNADVEGKRYTAEAVEESIENAIDRSTEDLAREIRRDRQRSQSLFRKGGAALKSLLQNPQGA